MKGARLNVPHLIPPTLSALSGEMGSFARYNRGEYPETVVLSKHDFEAVKEEVRRAHKRQMYFSGRGTLRYGPSWIEAR